MDVIGTLAAFDPSSLSKLQYVANYASAGSTVSIPKSKFVIVFPYCNFMLASSGNGYSVAPSQPMLLVPGANITLRTQDSQYQMNFNGDGTVVTIYHATYYIFGYCAI